MRLLGSPSFSALVSPLGIHAVEYRHARNGLRIVRSMRESGTGGDAAGAAERLASLLESAGGRGGRVSVVVTGFGSYHHIVSLPAAPREVLLPVAAREMRRFYPDLFSAEGAHPIIDFVEIDSTGQAIGGNTRELLIAGVPRGMVERMAEALQRRGMRLEHWTLLPLVMQRLFESFADPDGSRAVLVLTPEAPLLGFFHRGELRLFSEPHFEEAERETLLESVVEQIRRGQLFLRQQFRGARVDLLQLAAETNERHRGIADALQRRLEIRVEPFGPYGDAPGAVTALGAALDARSDRGLNLVPPEMRPPPAARRWSRSLAVASAVVLVAAGAWWAGRAMQAEARALERVREARESLADRAAAFAEVRSVVEERQAHARRAALLASLGSQSRELPELLWALQGRPDIQVEDLALTRTPTGWTGTLTGAATAATGAEATRSAQALYQELSRSLPDGSVSLERLSSGEPAYAAAADEPATGEVAIRFQISFIVGSGSELNP